MSDFDLLVRSERDIGIADGKFVAIGPNLSGAAREEIDATRWSVFPGVIDAHVHFNEPGRTHWEGFETGARAAAAGGTTTIFDMPLNGHPPTIDGPSFDAKLAAAEKVSLVDFGLWGGLVPGNLEQLETLRDRGVVGLKAFMCNSGIEDFPYVDDETLREGMSIAADLELIVAVHAESQELTQKLTGEKAVTGRTTVSDYLESRPVAAELEAIDRALHFAAAAGCRLHIVHVSCGSGVKMIATAHAKGVDVTCETCPHYLVLTANDMETIGAVAKCAPPLRPPDEQEELWNQLRHVATIGSDHSPSPPEMKIRSNFFEVWGGISGCQHLLPLLIDATRNAKRAISFQQIADLTSSNVAKRFALAGKGGIAIGQDADVTLVELDQEDPVTNEGLHYRHRQTPYAGRTLSCRVTRTILRGQTIYRDGKFHAQPSGKLLRPQRG